MSLAYHFSVSALFKILSLIGLAKTARRGPTALGRRAARKRARAGFNRRLLRTIKP